MSFSFLTKIFLFLVLVVEDTATIRKLKSTVARTLALKIKRENGPEHISWYVVLLWCAFFLRSYSVFTVFFTGFLLGAMYFQF